MRIGWLGLADVVGVVVIWITQWKPSLSTDSRGLVGSWSGCEALQGRMLRNPPYHATPISQPWADWPCAYYGTGVTCCWNTQAVTPWGRSWASYGPKCGQQTIATGNPVKRSFIHEVGWPAGPSQSQVRITDAGVRWLRIGWWDRLLLLY